MRSPKALLTTIIIATAVFVCALFAAEKRTAEITDIEGMAEVQVAGETKWEKAVTGSVLNEGDAVKTSDKSRLVLDIDGKWQAATVEVKENSSLRLAELTANPQTGSSRTLLDLAIGEVLIKAQKLKGDGSKFEVKTPTSVVGVRGTTFSVKVEAIEE